MRLRRNSAVPATATRVASVGVEQLSLLIGQACTPKKERRQQKSRRKKKKQSKRTRQTADVSVSSLSRAAHHARVNVQLQWCCCDKTDRYNRDGTTRRTRCSRSWAARRRRTGDRCSRDWGSRPQRRARHQQHQPQRAQQAWRWTLTPPC